MGWMCPDTALWKWPTAELGPCGLPWQHYRIIKTALVTSLWTATVFLGTCSKILSSHLNSKERPNHAFPQTPQLLQRTWLKTQIIFLKRGIPREQEFRSIWQARDKSCIQLNFKKSYAICFNGYNCNLKAYWLYKYILHLPGTAFSGPVAGPSALSSEEERPSPPSATSNE